MAGPQKPSEPALPGLSRVPQAERTPIRDYALIGDCRSAALISRNGSLDWLCWPRFDSPSLFGRLLDSAAGHWRLGLAEPVRPERRYVPETNVLETTYRGAGGVLRVTDLMPARSERDKSSFLFPDHELVRVAECEQGEVEVECDLQPRPDYGRLRASPRELGRLGVRFRVHRADLWLRTDMPVVLEEAGLRGRARLRAGERFRFSLVYAKDWPAVLPLLGDETPRVVEHTVRWWREWSSAMRYDGPRRESVLRSALILKLLSYSPSGAVVAAPTTSLPERLGGDLNWDYRYCWLRDASLTVSALYGLGFHPEADEFIAWMLHATRLTWPRLRVLYDVHGNKAPAEKALPLEGYGGAKPVRVGNEARDQLQLDIYGEVVDAATQHVHRGARLDGDTSKMLCSIGEYVMKNWERPDAGLWERRSGNYLHTHSRLMCWVALDRLARLHEQGHLCRGRGGGFRPTADRIAEQIRTRAWNAELGTYVDRLDGRDVDASLLALARHGLEPASSERMRATYAAVRRRLGEGPLLYRYRDGESPGEAPFGVCCFWAVQYLALGGGTREEALALFEQLLGYANDVGLYGEEIDPRTGEAIGNFPQGFTHIGLINAALAIAGAGKGG